jgi:hypothetical protein
MRFGFPGVLVASLLLAASAHGRTVVVSPGPGAFQAGFDSLVSGRVPGIGTDTLLVEPGFYDEHLLLRVPITAFFIRCPAGPAATRVRAIALEDPHGGTSMSDVIPIHGLGVLEHVDMGEIGSFATWRGCTFEGGFSAIANGSLRTGALGRCELHGRVDLVGFMGGSFEDLRFVGATLFVQNLPAEVVFRRCTFEGPADTAVIARPSIEGYLSFEDCTFTGCSYALALAPKLYVATGVGLARCRFEDIRVAAICSTQDEAGNDTPLGVNVGDCRFERCGTAVLLTSPVAHWLGFDRDTVIDCSGPAVSATVGGCSMRGTLIRGGRSDAVRLRMLPGPGHWSNAPTVGPVTLVESRFEANRGIGVVLRDTVDQQPTHRQGILIAGNTFERNDGAGALLAVHHANIRDNLAARNGGTGLAIEILDPPLFPSAIERNTCVLNGGDGLSMDASLVFEGGPVDVHNNLVAGNGGFGLVASADLDTVPTRNDSWMNLAGAYSGVPVTAENLELDPGFCDPAHDDFHLQAASPCAPAGPFGQIGALGVGCDASAVELATDRDATPVGGGAPIEIALLGSRLFDVTTVDRASLRLNGAPLPLHERGRFSCASRDVNGDGLADLALTLHARDVDANGTGALDLEARTTSGLLLTASRTFVAGERRPAPLAPDGPTVPLAIRTIASEATAGRVALEVSLPARDAVLSLFDVAGRHMWSRALDDLTTGTHRIDVPTRLRPGLYFARIARPGESAVARIVVLR